MIFDRFRSIVVLLLMGLLSSCYRSGDDSSISTTHGPAWYSMNLNSEHPVGGGWLTYRKGSTICESLLDRKDSLGVEFVRSTGPWWTDGNHASPGLGYLHLLAFAYHENWSEDGVIPGLEPGAPLDLRDALISVRWRPNGLNLPRGVRLYFWFQTKIPSAAGSNARFVNYLYVGQELKANTADGGSWTQTSIQLDSDERHYACLGSNIHRTETYSCELPPRLALRDWNVNLGIVAFFDHTTVASSIDGSLDIAGIEIRPDLAVLQGKSLPRSRTIGERPKSTCK